MSDIAGYNEMIGLLGSRGLMNKASLDHLDSHEVETRRNIGNDGISR